MHDLNDLYYFAAVVQHQGFSAAARATGIEKTRLSRRVAELEKQLGVRLLQRTTRNLTLTEAGRRFYDYSVPVVEGARSAFDSLFELSREPAGTVRLSCPVVMAQNYLAPILPGFMATHPKVKVIITATDREINLIEERFDLTFRACELELIDESSGLVARNLGRARRILVASPAYLNIRGLPRSVKELEGLETLSMAHECFDEDAQWKLNHDSQDAVTIHHKPVLISNDMRLQFEAVMHGIGIALLPEPIVAACVRSGQLNHVLPEWSAMEHIIHLLYPSPRGILPSVRSLIDYLMINLPATLQEKSV